MQHTQQIACIFDLDGVLVDTAVYHYKAWKQLANSLGFDFTQLQNEQLKGVNRMRSLEMILDWGGMQKSAEEKEELASLKNSWYVAMINKMTTDEVLPGSLTLLTELKSSGIKIALGSASKNSSIILQRTNLAHFFDAIVDGNSVTTSKPDPEVFLKAAEMLNTEPENCVVFEDAQAGVMAALAGNMKVIGIGDEEHLKETHLIAKDLSEITLGKILALRNN
ncbi:beta-phosphoglucomutase [Pedobacter panaciterrae]|jgi:beta-phosphoglucomutase|uniref:Beta-phosphoglucomutase n=1 Tax=Pedobacter panaciterrae TaxID=363849 RepID=A0ABU8NQA7_9SPHI|nr:beta-phosphoglucomutase [uncultured Pedobacter sp.]